MRLEAYGEKKGDLFADLGAPVLNKCADMESRGGVSTVRNQDVRKDVSKLVEKEGGGGAAEPGSASISAGDAQPMGVDIRVSNTYSRRSSIFWRFPI